MVSNLHLQNSDSIEANYRLIFIVPTKKRVLKSQNAEKCKRVTIGIF